MTREYQLIIDFEMNDYDNWQERDDMIKFLRILMEHYTEGVLNIHLKEGWHE